MPQFDRSLDQFDMYGKIADWPEQVARSLPNGIDAGKSHAADAPRCLVWAGMGGSAIGGDFAAAIAQSRASFPILVHRGGHLPAWVGKQDRGLLVSFSGNTAETVDAAEAAASRGIGLDLLTSGGKLGPWGEAQGIPVVKVPGGRPPRSALGDLFSSSLGLLAGRGWIDLPQDEIDETHAGIAEVTRINKEEPTDASHPCSPLIELLDDRLPMIYGTGAMLPVARRWANQLNENSKRPAHWGELPEMNHNEVVAYLEGTPWGERSALIFLVDPDSPADVLKRVDVTLSLAERAGWKGQIIHANGGTGLARLLTMTILGDWLSYWVALAEKVDPTPIPTIDALKAALEA